MNIKELGPLNKPIKAKFHVCNLSSFTQEQQKYVEIDGFFNSELIRELQESSIDGQARF